MKKLLGVILTIAGSVMAILCFVLNTKGQISTVIGGADGPTSIFIAGKVGGASAAVGMIIGVVLLAAGIFMIVRKKRKSEEKI